MLFRSFQGVIPANRDRIINAIAGGVARNLLDRETIRKAVHESNIVQGSIDEVILGIKRLISGESWTEWNVVMASAMLAMLPPALVVILMQKWFVKGLIETEK